MWQIKLTVVELTCETIILLIIPHCNYCIYQKKSIFVLKIHTIMFFDNYKNKQRPSMLSMS